MLTAALGEWLEMVLNSHHLSLLYLCTFKPHSDCLRENHMSRDMTKPSKWVCAQRRLRLSWASTQSDQSSLCIEWVAKDPRFLPCRLRRLWAEMGDALADPSLRWAHMPFCWFCHFAAHILLVDGQMFSLRDLLPSLSSNTFFYWLGLKWVKQSWQAVKLKCINI